MKILYFMSLMDASRIQAYLVNDLLNNEVDSNQILQEAIGLLIDNGFTQDVIKLYRKEKG